MKKPKNFIPYAKAFKLLADRIKVTPADMAGWVFLEKKLHGLDAYTNANELEPPPRFHYSPFLGTSNYMGLLASCWFDEEELRKFSPSLEERFISGSGLVDRWQNAVPGITAKDFIVAKIQESSLLDIHPLCGSTQATFPESLDYPPLEDGLFVLAHVIAIEEEELGSVKGSHANLAISGDYIPSPPARKDDWYFVIRDTISELVGALGRLPTMNETWTRLRTSPPKAYGVEPDIHRKEAVLKMDGKFLSKGLFKERWKRYCPNSK